MSFSFANLFWKLRTAVALWLGIGATLPFGEIAHFMSLAKQVLI